MSGFGSRCGAHRNSAVALIALLLSGLLLAAYSEPLSGVLTRRAVDTTKSLLAGCAALLLLADAGLRWRGRADRWRRSRDALLVAVALASALAWSNFLQFHYPHFTHYSDTFHYYLGSKYFPELGYTRLYACVAVADAEAGPGTGVAGRSLRNLETNRMEPASAAIADPGACKRHFSPERWASFAHDTAWFRGHVSRARWHAMQRDHGYNPPPSWGMLGGRLANLGSASEFQIHSLTAIDPALMALMWACVGWAFGWRALCVAVIYWGTNLFGVFGWNGGAFLREGWLAAAIAGICCLRRDKPATGGALLAISALLRIFPVVLLVAIGLRAGWEMLRERRLRLDPAHRRVFTGALLAVLTIGSLSLLGAGGGRAWAGFADNSRLHLATPLKNHVGLRTVLAYDAAAVDRRIQAASAIERYERWSDARIERFAGRKILYWTLLAGFAALLSFAVRGQPDWVAAVLGIGLIPVAFELTNYYYAILLGYGLLVDSREAGFEARGAMVGAGLCGVAALSWGIVERWQWQDEIFTWCSALVLVYAAFCTVLLSRGDASHNAPSG